MASLPLSGPISFSQINSFMGGSGTISMSQLAYTIGKASISNSNVNMGAFQGSAKALQSGFLFRGFSQGYHNEDPTFFTRYTETSSGIITNFTNITSATNSVYTSDGGSSNFSVEWYGFFYAPTTGTYTFTIGSDDGGYVWMGPTARSGYTVANCFINNGGNHPVVYASGSISLTAGTYTPMRIQFGQGGGGYNCIFSFSGPGISSTNNFSGYIFYPLGTNSLFPGEYARTIKAANTNNVDRTYFINVNGTSTPTYCLMNTAWNGGGWMMMMKATRGTTFNYNSTYWTNTDTTLNTTSTDLTDADAKFNVMNYTPVKDLLALWPDTGYTGGGITSPPISTWTWLLNNYSSTNTTLITGLSNANSRFAPTDPTSLSPWPGTIMYGAYITITLSAQTPIDSYTIGIGGNIANSRQPTKYALIGSNNGSTWYTIDQPTSNVTYSNNKCTRSVSYTAANFQYYRIVIQSLGDLTYWYLVINYIGLFYAGNSLFNSGNAISGTNGAIITNGSLSATVNAIWLDNGNFNNGRVGNLSELLTNTTLSDNIYVWWGVSTNPQLDYLKAWYPSGNVSSGSSVYTTSTVNGFAFTGFNVNIWSMQSGIAAHVLGGSNLPGNPSTYVRWGFITNNEADWASSDVSGGIGMSIGSYSAGDYIGCCQITTGFNRTMRVQLFGR
jgi:hypothetical protein